MGAERQSLSDRSSAAHPGVPCPYCKAPSGVACRTTYSGEVREPHETRQAEEIRRLRAEVAQLDEERRLNLKRGDDLEAENETLNTYATAAADQLTRQQDEIDRLREALEPFVFEDGCGGGGVPFCARSEKKCRWCKAAELFQESTG